MQNAMHPASNSEDKQAANRLLTQAREQLKSGRKREAGQLLKQAIQADPLDHRPWLLLLSIAPAHARQQCLDKARELAPESTAVQKAAIWLDSQRNPQPLSQPRPKPQPQSPAAVHVPQPSAQESRRKETQHQLPQTAHLTAQYTAPAEDVLASTSSADAIGLLRESISAPPPPVAAGRTRSWTVAIAALCALLFFAIAGIGAWFYFQQTSSPIAETTQSASEGELIAAGYDLSGNLNQSAPPGSAVNTTITESNGAVEPSPTPTAAATQIAIIQPTATPIPDGADSQRAQIQPKEIAQVDSQDEPRARWTATPSPTPTPVPTASPIPTFTADQYASVGWPSVSANEKWVDVNLTTQMLVAYIGYEKVFETPVSSGLYPNLTVTGQFRIYHRLESQTMDGRRLGFDYVTPNVPHVQYFYGDFALHGAYWHNNFGQPMSHGCVNLALDDAAWLFEWADFGTLVNVHY